MLSSHRHTSSPGACLWWYESFLAFPLLLYCGLLLPLLLVLLSSGRLLGGCQKVLTALHLQVNLPRQLRRREGRVFL